MDYMTWAIDMAESILAGTGPDGFHPEIKKRWAYVPGMAILAFLRLWEQTNDKRYYDYAQKHIDVFVSPKGDIQPYTLEEYNLDQINEGKTLFPLYAHTQDKKYALAAELLATQLMGHPRTSEGGFWHKKIYPFQMWLDGLYMSSPFMAEYAKTFNYPAFFDETAHQILTVERRTRDPKTGLLYHGWDETHEQEWCNPATGTSRHFWSRGMGWYAMAIVDSLEHFPKNHPQRGTIAGILERMVNALERVQDPATGLWYQVLDQGKREGNYLEASGSCMFVYAIAKGVRTGFLSPYYRKMAVAGYEGLINHFVSKDAGIVHLQKICKGAGLGNRPYRDGSYTYYLSEEIVSDQFMGTAPFIFASLEMHKLGQKPTVSQYDAGNPLLF